MSRPHDALNRRRWERVRRQVLDRDGWRCRECGRAGRLEVHHRVELRHGGAPYDAMNLETLCRFCHIDRHRRQLTPPEQAWADLVAEITATPVCRPPDR